MIPKAQLAYIQHHCKLYHCQGKVVHKCRCKRERERYHSLEGKSKKLQIKQCTKLERDSTTSSRTMP
jgi:hypothetical protein